MKIKILSIFLVILLGSFQNTTSTKVTNNSLNSSTFNLIVVDVDGKEYKTIIIGNQEWMAEDLEVKHYNNGDPIDFIKCDRNFDKQKSENWNSTKEGAYTIAYKPSRDCFVKNGRNSLINYNWYAVNDDRGLAPKGWHIPSKQEFEILINYLGGIKNAGKVMKSISGWDEKYASNGNNISGFNALPTGMRTETGFHMGYSQYAYYWMSDQREDYYADFLSLGWQGGNDNSAIIFTTGYKQYGLSIRCIKN
jgi:uncharacterized protein (TIGR02145 family)